MRCRMRRNAARSSRDRCSRCHSRRAPQRTSARRRNGTSCRCTSLRPGTLRRNPTPGNCRTRTSGPRRTPCRNRRNARPWCAGPRTRQRSTPCPTRSSWCRRRHPCPDDRHPNPARSRAEPRPRPHRPRLRPRPRSRIRPRRPRTRRSRERGCRRVGWSSEFLLRRQRPIERGSHGSVALRVGSRKVSAPFGSANPWARTSVETKNERS